MNTYDPKSCSALEKPYYRPIEAALRWCGLIQQETAILQKTGDELIPSIAAFPQWPCLRTNAEKIHEAVLNGELPSGRDGKTVQPGEHVKKERLTIRHTDLKSWMSRHYPDQKPAFLFDEVERSTHSAINAESFRALRVEKLALEIRVVNAIEAYQKLKKEHVELLHEHEALRQRSTPLGVRAEAIYLNIIAGLLDLMLGTSPAGKPHSVFSSQSAIIESLEAYYGDRRGMSASTLEDRFATANRNFKAA